MPIVDKSENGVGLQITGKVGKALRYGRRILGYFEYGQDPPIIGPGRYGIKKYGVTKYGRAITQWGIYKRHSELGTQHIVKKDFYIPANPQTAIQQANRSAFANAVLAWQNLTESEKKVYNKKTEGKPLSGFNLFIREYMLSH